jgi:hypothetical protein
MTQHDSFLSEGKEETIPPRTSTTSSDAEIVRSPTNRSTHKPDLELARTKSIAETLSPLREFVFVGLLCSAQFVTQAGLVNTLNILHIIGSDLGITDAGVLSWLIAGYSLTVGTFILLSGRCGDLFGYKIMIIIGYAWFGIWNIIAGCSVYAPGNGGQVLFIFARVLSGIGPAILLPNSLGLLGATYEEGRRKDMVFSFFGACAPSKFALHAYPFHMLTVHRRSCRWRNVRWPLVSHLVALDILDIWNRPHHSCCAVCICPAVCTCANGTGRTFLWRYYH